MDQVWKGLSNLDPRDPGGFYKKPLLSDQRGGFLGTQDLFFAHFTAFACTFFTVIFANYVTIGYASFDAKKNYIDLVVFSLISIN